MTEETVTAPTIEVNTTDMIDGAVKETETKKSGSACDAVSSSSTLKNNEQQEAAPVQYESAILQQLARQLEYYFSKANLDKDTYVVTLRELNDGCVPVNILQRFQKVQAFAPLETEDAIIKAASEHSSNLLVAPIDTKTGKRVEDELPGRTILAVGTTTGEPLDNEKLQSVLSPVPTSPGTPIQNTIIIREVDPNVTEDEIRSLFNHEDCPPVQSLYLDVFNCWFVTLDTTSRDDMLFAMMLLRSQYLGDEPVKARLKSLVKQADPAFAPVLPVLNPSNMSLQQHESSNNGKGNKKKQKRRSKGNNKGNNNNNNNQGAKKNGSNNASNNANENSSRDGAPNTSSSNKKKATPKPQPKPDFSPASFPALKPAEDENSNKVEVVVDGMDAPTAEPKSSGSDSASTATTMSSSSSTSKGKQHPIGGYAAALLKAKPANFVAPAKAETASSKGKGEDNMTGAKKLQAKQSSDQVDVARSAATVVVKPPVWGGGRSFADVLAN